MKKLIEIFLLPVMLLAALAGCDGNDGPSMDLDGETWIVSMKLNEYIAYVDNASRTVHVAVPETFDASAMTITDLQVSDGAVSSLNVGDVLNLSVAQVITVTNGDAYLDYTIVCVHDSAKILSFKINDDYAGIINEASRTITVRVPMDADVAALRVVMTLSDGAEANPVSGSVVDFTEPVEIKVTYKSATAVYVVTVVPTDKPGALFLGLASTMEGLKPEEYAAAMWMMMNVSGAQYASFDDIALGKVDLSGCEVIWWHFHHDGGIDNMGKFDNSAPEAVNAIGRLKEYYNAGGHFLLSRFATWYAVKLGASADNNGPNNCWGGSETSPETVGGPWNFFIQGHESHPLYQNLVMSAGESDKVYTFDTGYRNTNSTCQWHIGSDWGGYADVQKWRDANKGVDLAYGGDGAVVVWEYPSEGNEGNILCIGSGCYDWYAHDYDASSDQYHVNVGTLTLNAINYLTE